MISKIVSWFTRDSPEPEIPIDRETLHPKYVYLNHSGSPSIEPRDLVKHKKVRENIRKGAQWRPEGATDEDKWQAP